jgi:hypothetical protein
MVGSCPHCKRPWYTAGRSAPDACRACGGALSNDGQPETPVSPQKSVSAEGLVGEINYRQGRLNAFRESGEVSRCLMIIGGLGLLAAGAWALETWNFKRTAIPTTGQVVSSSEYSSRRSSGTIATVEYYSSSGRKTITVWNPEQTSVPLLVSKTNPSDARSTTGLWTNKVGIGIFSAILLAGGLLLRPSRSNLEALLA